MQTLWKAFLSADLHLVYKVLESVDFQTDEMASQRGANFLHPPPLTPCERARFPTLPRLKFGAYQLALSLLFTTPL